MNTLTAEHDIERHVALKQVRQYIQNRLAEIKEWGKNEKRFRKMIYNGGGALEEFVLDNFKAQHKIMQYQQAMGKDIEYTVGNDLWIDDALCDRLTSMVEQEWKQVRPDELHYN